jgi:hypothetical protein
MFYSCRVRLDAESIGVRSASSYVLLHHTGFEGAVILRPQVDEARFSRLVPEVLRRHSATAQNATPQRPYGKVVLLTHDPLLTSMGFDSICSGISGNSRLHK